MTDYVLNKYHVNPLTEQAVKCDGKNCPAPGDESKHAYTASDIKDIFDRERVLDYLSREPSLLTKRLQAEAPSDYSNLVTTILGEYLTDSDFQVMAVVPSGSILYNTEIPGRERHDYDVVVFVEDHETLARYKHTMISFDDTMVDFFIVPFSMIPHYIRQSQIIEGYFGVCAGFALYTEGFRRLDNEGELLSLFFTNLEEYVAKHAAKEYPPHRLQREGKHMLRWRQYLSRKDISPFSPRLSEDERAAWLKGVESL